MYGFHLSDNIVRLRRERKMTQEEVADFYRSYKSFGVKMGESAEYTGYHVAAAAGSAVRCDGR